MPPLPSLIYPTIDLFLYDLAEGLGQSDATQQTRLERFLHRIYGDKLSPDLVEKCRQMEQEPTDLIRLLGAKRYEDFPIGLDGYAYPLRLGDTYALRVDCTGEDEKGQSAPKPISILKSTRQILSNQLTNTTGTIGQSWLVWGILADPNQSVEDTAKQCYENLGLFADPDWERDRLQQGSLGGATWFDCWRSPGDRGDLSQNAHLLIGLFPSHYSLQQAGRQMEKLYPKLLRLLLSRNKVIWAYYQGRQLKASLKQTSQAIQVAVRQLPAQVNSPRLNLTQLQQDLADNLQLFSGYATYLSALEEQRQTIKANLENYQKQRRAIARMDSQADVNFLKSFSRFAREKYLPQIESDYASLNAGLRLLENTIRTIEGIIEIERTRRDRQLNETVAITGVGLGVSGVTATALSLDTSSRTTIEVNQPAINLILLSLLIGASVSAIVWGIFRISSRGTR